MVAQAAEQLSNAGAQREPSMEEILASIRRIIEDSDTGRPESPIPAAANTSAEPARNEIDAFREELQLPEAPVAVSAPKHEVHEVRQESAHVAAAPRDLIVEQPPIRTTMTPGNHPQSEPVQATMPRRDHDDVDALPRAQPAQALSTGKTSIISETAGRQVAAAFDELSEVFAASRRRSFDEIAEEMIRPMLQDWLDNNLPTLVEKLVREEIERIARTGTR